MKLKIGDWVIGINGLEYEIIEETFEYYVLEDIYGYKMRVPKEVIGESFTKIE